MGLISCFSLQSCAYFNTFFLTKKYFKNGFSFRKKDFYGPMSTEERNYYSKSLEKASYLFQFHKKSGWVDDALLLVGQIYYFRRESNEYVRALTKFNEILNNYPQSKLLNETKLWKARTLIALKDLNEAEKILTELLKNEQNKKMFSQIYLELGNIYWERELYSLSNDYFQRSLENIPSYLGLFANERCGDTYTKLFQFNEAHQYYLQALKYGSDKTTQYKLQFKIIDAYNDEGNFIKSKQLVDELIRELTFLESKSVNRSSFVYLPYLVTALLKKAMTTEKSGNYTSANMMYEELVNTYPLDSITIYAHYQLGNYYLFNQQNLKTSLFNFEKVSEQKNNPLIPEIQSKIEVIKRIQNIKNNIQEMDLEIDSFMLDFYQTGSNFSPSVHPNTLSRWRLLDSTFIMLFPAQSNSTNLNQIKQYYQEIESGQIYTWQLELAEIYLLDLKNPHLATQIYQNILENKTSSNENKAIATFYLAWCYETLFHDNSTAQYYYQKLIHEYYSTRFIQNMLGITLPDDSIQISSARNANIYSIIENYLSQNKIDSAYWFTNTWLANYRDSIYQPIVLTKLAYLFNVVIYDQKKANQILAKMEELYPNHDLTLAYKRSRTEMETPKTPKTPKKSVSDSTLVDSILTDSTRIKDSTLKTPVPDSTGTPLPRSDTSETIKVKSLNPQTSPPSDTSLIPKVAPITPQTSPPSDTLQPDSSRVKTLPPPQTPPLKNDSTDLVPKQHSPDQDSTRQKKLNDDRQ